MTCSPSVVSLFIIPHLGLLGCVKNGQNNEKNVKYVTKSSSKKMEDY